MVEREPAKETIGRGDLFFLWHPGTGQIFSGYGLAMRPGSKDLLSGLLMVDRPRPADPEWLAEVEVSSNRVNPFGLFQSRLLVTLRRASAEVYYSSHPWQPLL